MSKKTSDTIAKEIENQIFQGFYADGDRLDEVKLAAAFGVSRTPVREALHKLAQSELVTQIPRRGVFVKQPGPIELLQMFEVMAEIEGVCARLAASRISIDDLRELTEANEKCALALKNNEPDKYYEENETFHHVLYRATANEYLLNDALKLQRRLSPFRRTQLQVNGRMEQSLTEHYAVIDALKAGDGERAAKCIRDHVHIQNEKFHLVLSQHKLQSA